MRPCDSSVDCRLTVPATFDLEQRACLRDAASRAGFRQVEEILEPIAGARYWLSGDAVAAEHLVCLRLWR